MLHDSLLLLHDARASELQLPLLPPRGTSGSSRLAAEAPALGLERLLLLLLRGRRCSGTCQRGCSSLALVRHAIKLLAGRSWCQAA
jgi:hypothetical protein